MTRPSFSTKKEMLMSKRFFGLDVHKNFIVAAAVNPHQEVVVKPCKISSADLEDWILKRLTQDDEVVIEAMSGSWVIYDLLAGRVSRVVVAHPYHVKLIASSFVKTDKRDAIALARLLAANILPEVWVPPVHVRELRSLIYERSILVRKRAAAKNRLRGIYQSYRMIAPDGLEAFKSDYWEKLNLPLVEKMRARHTSADIEQFTQQIKETETMIAQLSAQPPWVDDTAFLIQLPGIGLVTAMTILAAIGEIGRFPSSKKLVGYAGLGARVHSSGETHKTGGITKQGRGELRYAMIEAAWNAIKHSPFWKQRYEQLSRRMGKQKAATAIARKLLVVVWSVLSKREADRHADPDVVARSMLLWSWENRLATSLRMKPIEFTAMQLNRLGIRLDKLTYRSTIYQIPIVDVTKERCAEPIKKVSGVPNMVP
jgi:transposase